MNRIGLVLLLVLGVVLGPFVVRAQEAVKVPTLTTEQKQSIEILSLRMDNANKAAQLAQLQFEKARTEIGALVQSLQIAGYDLDLGTMTYTKKPEKKE